MTDASNLNGKYLTNRTKSAWRQNASMQRKWYRGLGQAHGAGTQGHTHIRMGISLGQVQRSSYWEFEGCSTHLVNLVSLQETYSKISRKISYVQNFNSLMALLEKVHQIFTGLFMEGIVVEIFRPGIRAYRLTGLQRSVGWSRGIQQQVDGPVDHHLHWLHSDP